MNATDRATCQASLTCNLYYKGGYTMVQQRDSRDDLWDAFRRGHRGLENRAADVQPMGGASPGDGSALSRPLQLRAPSLVP